MALILDMIVNDKGSKVVKNYTDSTKKSLAEVTKSSTSASSAMEAGNKRNMASIESLRLKYLAYAAAVGAIIYAVKKAVNETVNYRDEIVKFSKATGVSTENLAAFRYAAEISGANVDSMGKALGRLARNMQEATQSTTGPAAEAFQKMGINVVDSGGKLRDLKNVIFEVADAFKNSQNATEKAAIAQDLFGRSGLELVPLLNEGSAGIERLTERAKILGLTFSEQAGKQAEDYKDAMLDLKSAWQGLSMTVMTGVIPALTAIAKTFTDGIIKARYFTQVLATELWPIYLKVQEAGLRFFITMEKIDPTTGFSKGITENEKRLADLQNMMIGVETARKQSLDEVARGLENYYKNQNKVNQSLGETPAGEIPSFTTAGTTPSGGAAAKEEMTWNDALMQSYDQRKELRKKEWADFDEQVKVYNEALAQQKQAEQDFVDFSKAKKTELSDFNRDAYENQLEIEKAMFEERTNMAAEYYNENLTLEQNLAAVEKRINEEKLAVYQSVLGSIGQLFYSLSDQMGGALEAYKLFAITETIISTIKSAQKAYEAVISNVWLGPAAVPAAMAAAAAATLQGMARVNEIRKMAKGGEFITTGPQMIIVGDNPSGRERVSVTPLDAGPKYQMGQRNITFNVIINEKVDKQTLRNELIPMMQQVAEYG
jgi:hypothetical protein